MDDREFLRAICERESERLRERASGQDSGRDPDEIDLLAALAADPGNGLVELAPGVFIVDRDGWGATR